MEQLLSRSDTWAARGCSIDSCFQYHLGGGEGGSCQQEGILYLISCLKCKEGGTTAEYVGESARTGERRGCEHLRDLRNKKDGKPLWDHSKEHHEGKVLDVDFKMKVLRKFKIPLEMQIEIEGRGWSSNAKT